MTEFDTVFDSLEWHDAVLLNLEIDRTDPGVRDEVVLIIEWPDGRNQKVRFTHCYRLDAEMNFGVIAPESIRAARCVADVPMLDAIRERWRALGVALDDLRCFEIITNSTASAIRVYATHFEISNV